MCAGGLVHRTVIGPRRPIVKTLLLLGPFSPRLCSVNLSELGARAKFEPKKARAEITAAFVACNGVGVRAAEHLKLSYRNLTRLVARLDCGPAIDAECEKLGFPRHQGRPRAVKRTRKKAK